MLGIHDRIIKLHRIGACGSLYRRLDCFFVTRLLRGASAGCHHHRGRHTSLSSTGGSSKKSGTLLRSERYEVPSSSSSNCNASSSAKALSDRRRQTRRTCLLQGLLRQAHQVLHKISLGTPVSRLPAPTIPPCRNAYSTVQGLSTSQTGHSAECTTHLYLVDIDLPILLLYLLVRKLHRVHGRHCVL